MPASLVKYLNPNHSGAIDPRAIRPWAASVVVLAVCVGLVGCASQSSRSGKAGAGGVGISEGNMSAGSSLARARRGLPPEEDGILKDVHFDIDSYDLNSEGRTILSANTDWLKDSRLASVEIEGHADERGTIEYNLALGARRAKAVKDYLTVLGVNAKRITTISYGEELPVCNDQTADCFRRNRRAHFVIVSP